MSVRDRVQDAEVLWRLERREGAWVLALVAAAATARKRYPKAQVRTDREAFTTFIRDVTLTVVRGLPVAGPGGPRMVLAGVPLEDIIYEHLRCHLVHEATLAPEIQFSETIIEDGLPLAQLRAGSGRSPNIIPGAWVLNLLQAVREAPENAGEFRENDQV